MKYSVHGQFPDYTIFVQILYNIIPAEFRTYTISGLYHICTTFVYIIPAEFMMKF